MTCYSELFTPTHIGKVQLKNRTSMAPMGPVGYADAFGGFHQRLQDYYVQRARHGVGLIITGICSVDTTIEGIAHSGAAMSHDDADRVYTQLLSDEREDSRLRREMLSSAYRRSRKKRSARLYFQEHCTVRADEPF